MATITWDEGTLTRLNADAVFTSGDIGTDIRVGDLGGVPDQQETRA